MKTAHALTVLGILIAVVLLGIWSRRRVSEGFEDAPECTYSPEISNKYLLGCVNNPNTPFVCQPYATFEEAKKACNENPLCRGVTKTVSLLGTEDYTIRSGGPGATDYTNLETMKRDLLGESANEAVYLITNLAQCKPNTTASTVVAENKTIGARMRGQTLPVNQAPSSAPPVLSAAAGAQLLGIASSAQPSPVQPQFQISGDLVTVPANTLISVPAGQTIYARRAGVAESQPAGVGGVATPPQRIANAIQQGLAAAPGTGSNTYQPLLTEASFQTAYENLSAEEKFALQGLPQSTQIKIVDATYRSIPLRDALTPEELNTIRIRRQQAQQAGGVVAALATTPSNALSSNPGSILTGADLQAIQQAAAAGVAEATTA